jgi:hypothetical protein
MMICVLAGAYYYGYTNQENGNSQPCAGFIHTVTNIAQQIMQLAASSANKDVHFRMGCS